MISALVAHLSVHHNLPAVADIDSLSLHPSALTLKKSFVVLAGIKITPTLWQSIQYDVNGGKYVNYLVESTGKGRDLQGAWPNVCHNKKAFFREQTCKSYHRLVGKGFRQLEKATNLPRTRPAFTYFLGKLGILITFTRKDFFNTQNEFCDASYSPGGGAKWLTFFFGFAKGEISSIWNS